MGACHVMRYSKLAEALTAGVGEWPFICRDFPSSLMKSIHSRVDSVRAESVRSPAEVSSSGVEAAASITVLAHASWIDVAREGGCKDLAVFHRDSHDPASAAYDNQRFILGMIGRVGLVIMQFDHRWSNTPATTSVTLVASIIEKLLTLDRGGGRTNDGFLLERAGNAPFRRVLDLMRDLELCNGIPADVVQCAAGVWAATQKNGSRLGAPRRARRFIRLACDAKSYALFPTQPREAWCR